MFDDSDSDGVKKSDDLFKPISKLKKTEKKPAAAKKPAGEKKPPGEKKPRAPKKKTEKKGMVVLILELVVFCCNLNPLYTNHGFFLLIGYNKLGIVHCIYLGVSGYKFQQYYIVWRSILPLQTV